MKKILGFVLAAITLAACSSDREHILKIYNWADYIDEDLIGEFEQWYREQTGESVKIVYQTFDINETMLSKIEKGEEDYDAVCPSDYIIERMLRKDLLLPIDKNFGETPNYIDGSLSPYIVAKMQTTTPLAICGAPRVFYTTQNMCLQRMSRPGMCFVTPSIKARFS